MYTASYGVVAAEPGEELEETAHRADAALFEAKHEGRDRVVAHGDQASTNGNGSSRRSRSRSRRAPRTKPLEVA